LELHQQQHKNQSKRPTISLEVEEIPRALASNSQASFHRYYVPLKKDNTSQIKVLADGKYPLETSLVPPGVIIEGDMLDKVVSLKFMDHDITDEQKFSNFSREKLFCAKSVPGTKMIVLETHVWEIRIEKVGILICWRSYTLDAVWK
jgi:hypothetical protein